MQPSLIFIFFLPVPYVFLVYACDALLVSAVTQKASSACTSQQVC